ncbi:MAG: tetratricopeptide repeat protein [Candidatus Sulfotelmatobacter sp.]
MNLGLSTRRQNPAIGKPLTAVPELLSVRTFFVVALCLGAVAFAVYSPSLKFQFVLDDHRFTGDPRIQFPDHVWDYFANYVWAQFTGGPPSFYRPLFLVWLRINFILSAMSPWGWHLLSIVKHLAVAVLLGLLVLRLLRDRIAALIAASLFALHPAQNESVGWVTVPDPLMSAAILGALLLYLRWIAVVPQGQSHERKSRKTARSRKAAQPQLYWLVTSAAVCFAALLAKETSIIFPVLIFALPLLVPRGENGDADFRVRLRRALRQTVPFLWVTGLYLLMRFHALGGKLASRTQSLPWSTVLLSWPATLWFYVKVLLWPDHSRAFADPTLAQRFSFRGVIMPGLGVACAVAILALALIWVWKKARRDLPAQDAANVGYALVIGTLLLGLPILLTLDLNALNPGDFLHGRYTYLPSAGLMLLVGTVWHVAGELRVPLLPAAALLAVVFAVLAVSQEKQWKDDLTVFTVAHELAPHNAPVAKNLADAHVQAALQLADDGRCSEAMPVFQQVSQEYPQDWYAWAGLGDCFVQLNNLPKAEESLRRAAELSHDSRVMQQWQELRAHMGLPNSAPHD